MLAIHTSSNGLTPKGAFDSSSLGLGDGSVVGCMLSKEEGLGSTSSTKEPHADRQQAFTYRKTTIE